MAAPRPASMPAGGLRGAVEAQLESMSPRDRKLLVGLLAFVSILVLAIVIVMARSSIEARASRVRMAKDNLDLLQAMATEYEVADQKIARAEERLAEYKGQPLSAYMEKTAREMQLQEQLASVNPQDSEVVGNLRQTSYRVELKKVPLENALAFVSELEMGGYPLAIDLARLRTVNVAGEKMFDVTLEVVAYQLEEG